MHRLGAGFCSELDQYKLTVTLDRTLYQCNQAELGSHFLPSLPPQHLLRKRNMMWGKYTLH